MPTISTAPQQLTDLPALSKCVAFTEPSAVVTPASIELALGCVEPAATPTIRVVLLRSVDHGKTFNLVGTLLDGSDATCLGKSVPQLNAAHLFAAAGKVYLIVSPAR